MATPRIPNQKKLYGNLNGRLARYVLAVQSIYADLNAKAAKLGVQSGYNGEGEFKWSDYPELSGKIDELQSDFVADLGALVMRGTSEEWKQSNLMQDIIADKVIKTYTGEKNREPFTQYYQTNSPQLKAFQQRKDRGLNLSAKLWNQSEEYKAELEDVLSVAIERGTDAITLSKRISQYLQDFDGFKSDYTDKFGKATKVHDCEYRSIRLARSEINMSYRTAEQTRWKQFDFVVGYEIKLSGSHPKEDICDRLKGKYPKDFVWTGWHPNDLCYCIPLLKTEDEFFNDKEQSVNEVTDVPEQFHEWCAENRDYILAAEKHKTLPYFLRDNKEYYKNDLDEQNPFAPSAYSASRKANAKFAQSARECDDMLRSNASESWLGFTEKEKDGLYDYTYDASEINGMLRGSYVPPEDRKEEVQSQIEGATSALEKVKVTDADMYVVRGETVRGFCNRFGINSADLDNRVESLIGKTGVEPGFVSTTAFDKHLRESVNLKIYVPKGTKGIYCEPFSHYGKGAGGSEKPWILNQESGRKWDGRTGQDAFGNEVEFLLQRDTEFRIVSIKEKNEDYYIELEVVGQKKH